MARSVGARAAFAASARLAALLGRSWNLVAWVGCYDARARVRARGLGGRITSCGEENLLNLPGDRYRRENILIHEFAHAIHEMGLNHIDERFDGRLRKCFDEVEIDERH